MKTIIITFLSLLSLNALGQRLPDVQAGSLAAPSNIRVDGKYADWNDTYAAENKKTELFYSIANDDKNLYLIIKSANSMVAGKIMMGGITFIINTQGKKKEKDAISVTYPLVPRTNRNQGGRNGQGQNRPGAFQAGGQGRTQQQRDSASLVQRKAALASAKEIKISGFKDITDTLVSIYNEHGLKAVANFDQQGALVYELAIPLNLLGIDTKSEEFAYQIKVNGLSTSNFGGNFSNGGDNAGRGFGSGRPNGGFGGGGGGANMQDLTMPTDFWAKYTLFKK